eukprot:g55994.t1
MPGKVYAFRASRHRHVKVLVPTGHDFHAIRTPISSKNRVWCEMEKDTVAMKQKSVADRPILHHRNLQGPKLLGTTLFMISVLVFSLLVWDVERLHAQQLRGGPLSLMDELEPYSTTTAAPAYGEDNPNVIWEEPVNDTEVEKEEEEDGEEGAYELEPYSTTTAATAYGEDNPNVIWEEPVNDTEVEKEDEEDGEEGTRRRLAQTPVDFTCNGAGGTCGCAYDGSGVPITLNRFSGDDSDEKVWGCGGAFELASTSWDTQWGGSLNAEGPTGSVTNTVDGRCSEPGMVLRKRCFQYWNLAQGEKQMKYLKLGESRLVSFPMCERLPGITSCGGLRHLALKHCGWLTDAGLTYLAGLHQLQHLDLAFCEKLTDTGLARLAGLHQLQHLDLSYCRELTDAGLAHLAGLHQLQHLDLRHCRWVTRAGAEAAELARVPQLRLPAEEEEEEDDVLHFLSGIW